ncbi:MAG: hypothetical protein Q7S92_03365 [Candidatus Diapherotrites archaeon]|nr:hypothetical protein [Candidatus Diapherotrites archaeon]
MDQNKLDTIRKLKLRGYEVTETIDGGLLVRKDTWWGKFEYDTGTKKENSRIKKLRTIILLFVYFVGLIGVIYWIFQKRHFLSEVKQFTTTLAEEKKEQPTQATWLVRNVRTVLTIALIVIILQVMISRSTDYDRETLNTNNMSVDEVKASAQAIAYTDLFRYNEAHLGKIVVYTGRILQIVDGLPNQSFRVDAAPSASFDHEIIYLHNYHGTRLLENDIVKFYGRVTGLLEYEAVLGNKISIPSVEALHIEFLGRETIGEFYSFTIWLSRIAHYGHIQWSTSIFKKSQNFSETPPKNCNKLDKFLRQILKEKEITILPATILKKEIKTMKKIKIQGSENYRYPTIGDCLL